MSRVGPAPLNLAPSGALRTADPPALRRRATEHASEAADLAAAAGGVRAGAAQLVPSGWLGRGAASFTAAALAQADRLDAIALAGGDLGGALQALAAVLESAQAEAAATVAAGARLDHQVAEVNLRLARYPEPARPDPDPVMLGAAREEAIRLAQQLAAVEEAVRAAWRRATAAFDLIAYRMPALAAQMSDLGSPDWKPHDQLVALPLAQWRALVGRSPVCVDAGYGGGGLLIGPDGRRYPLVIPWLSRSGQRWTGDVAPTSTGGSRLAVADLDGADPDWQVIGSRTGVDEFGTPASRATKAAIIVAGLAGRAPTTIGRLRPDLLPRLRLSSSGYPTLAAGPVATPTAQPGGTGQVPREVLVADAHGAISWSSDPAKDEWLTTREARRGLDPPPAGPVTPVLPNVLALAESGIAGADTARRLDDGRAAAYRVTFEENRDGRLRARLTLYQVRSSGSNAQVLASNAAVREDGRLSLDPVAYRPPPVPVMRAAPSPIQGS